MARRRTRSTARRSSRSSYAPRRSTGRRSTQRSYRSRARSAGSRRAAPRQGRLVIEVVQSGAVRAGEPVSIGEKVASAPRLKPRF